MECSLRGVMGAEGVGIEWYLLTVGTNGNVCVGGKKKSAR